MNGNARDRRRAEPILALVRQLKLLVANDSPADAAERRIGELLATIEMTDLPRVDREMRFRADYETSTWDEMQPAQAKSLLQQRPSSVLVAAALSMHGNGYVRELAVRQLAGSTDVAALGWLTLRAGDWVSKIRDLATVGVEQWLEARHALELVRLLPLLEGGRFAAGRPAAGLAARASEVLGEPAALPAVLALLASPNPAVRRACVRVALEGASPLHVFHAVSKTGDVVSIRATLGRLPASEPHNREVGYVLLRSPDARLRSEGLWRLMREPGDDHAELLRRGLADRATSVRYVAQQWCASQGDDPHHRYRELLGEDPYLALLGLGDLGSAEDLATARTFLAHARAAVRLAALRLLAKAGRAEDIALFAERLLNGTNKERQEAVKGLRRAGCSARMLDELVAKALESDNLDAVRCVLFQVAPGADRWQRLALGLRVAARGGDVCEIGIETIRRTMVAWNLGGYRRWQGDLPAMRRDLERAQVARPVRPAPGDQKLFANVDQLLGLSG